MAERSHGEQSTATTDLVRPLVLASIAFVSRSNTGPRAYAYDRYCLAVVREGQCEAKQGGVAGKFDGSSSARSASFAWSVAVRFGDPRHGTFRYCCCIRTRTFRPWRCCVAVVDGFRGPRSARRNENPHRCVGPSNASRFGPRNLPVSKPIHDYDALGIVATNKAAMSSESFLANGATVR